jgi:hypothetical protein
MAFRIAVGVPVFGALEIWLGAEPNWTTNCRSPTGWGALGSRTTKMVTSKVWGSAIILQVPILVISGRASLALGFSSAGSFFFLYVALDQYFSNMKS